MGTDSVKLFNKALADQILAMEQAPLVHFLEENIETLKQKAFNLSLIVFEMKENGGPVNQVEEIFLLLRSEHVDQMIKSLNEHADDLRAMKAVDIEGLEEWRDLCAANPSYMVAYHFDF